MTYFHTTNILKQHDKSKDTNEVTKTSLVISMNDKPSVVTEEDDVVLQLNVASMLSGNLVWQ